jgi:lysozyme
VIFGATLRLQNTSRMIKMTPEMSVKLKKSLTLHEGFRNFPYTDSVGKITIGCGYNLTDRGLTDDWINTQYQKDVEYFDSELSKFHWFNFLNDDRQIVLIDMSFMGIKKLLEFKNMIAALEKHDYKTAASEMLDSDWAKEVHGRATQLAHAMESGVYNP